MCDNSQHHWIIAFLCICLTVMTTQAYYSNFQAIENKLDQVDKKLDVLTNEVSLVADTLLPESEHEDTSADPISLVAVHRVNGFDGNIFTVTYTKNMDDVETRATWSGQSLDMAESAEDGVYSILFTCNHSDSNVVVTFADRNHSSEMELLLRNSDSEELRQTKFTVPTLDIQHVGDLEYYHGKNAKVKVLVSSGNMNPGQGFTDLKPTLTVVKDRKYFYKASSMFVETQVMQQFLKSAEVMVTVDTSNEQLSGFLYLALTFSDSEALLVEALTVQRSLVIRPSTQFGAFPDGFLRFIESDDARYHQDMCRVSDNCSFSCRVIGESITDLDVLERQRYGSWEPVDTATNSEGYLTKTVRWTIMATDDDFDVREFQCVVKDAVHNTNESLTRRIHVVNDNFGIDVNRSGIEVDVNEMYPHLYDLHLTCTLTGRPILDAYFMLHVENEYGIYLGGREWYLGEGETLLNTTYPVDAETYEHIEGISCNMRGYGGRPFSHELTLPPLETS